MTGIWIERPDAGPQDAPGVPVPGLRKSTRDWLMASLIATTACMGTAPAAAGPAEDTAQAEKEFARGNLLVSMELWRKSAQAGHAPAQARLGDILDTAEEDAEAVEWYRKAAAQGDAAGEYGLGQMYAKGEGVAKDLDQARSYTLKAAGKNHAPAMLQALEIYRVGALGGTVDKEQAAAWEARVRKALGTDKLPPPPEPTSGKRK